MQVEFCNGALADVSRNGRQQPLLAVGPGYVYCRDMAMATACSGETKVIDAFSFQRPATTVSTDVTTHGLLRELSQLTEKISGIGKFTS